MWILGDARIPFWLHQLLLGLWVLGFGEVVFRRRLADVRALRAQASRLRPIAERAHFVIIHFVLKCKINF